MQCPESIEELQEMEKRLPLCRVTLYNQAKARIEKGAAKSVSEAARQIAEETGKSPATIRTAIQREESRAASLTQLSNTNKFNPHIEKPEPKPAAYKFEESEPTHAPIELYQPAEPEPEPEPVFDDIPMIALGEKEILEKAKEIKAVKSEEKKIELQQIRAEIASQIKESPSAPVVSLESYDTWLSRQPDCDLLITDPPYSTDVEDIKKFASEWLPAALDKIKPTGRAYIFIGAYPEEIQAYLSVKMPDQILVWTYRNTLGPAPKYDYKLNWQAILYYKMPEAPPLDCPIMIEQFSVQDISAPDGRQNNRFHTWQKPDEIAERIIRHSTKQGDIVLDPFCCTGTFPLAAARLDRVGSGCDIDIENLKIAEGRGCKLT